MRQVRALQLQPACFDGGEAALRLILRSRRGCFWRCGFMRRARVSAALEHLKAIEEARERRAESTAGQADKQKAPRVSTTDPEVRIIKMADGGFQPAWNMQIASAAEQQIVVAVDISSSSSDRGLLRPMLEAIGRRFGRLPRQYLADAGFTSNDQIEWAAGMGVEVYCPPVKSKHGTDPFQPRRGDGPGLLAWRKRMQSPVGQDCYKRRSLCECLNARARRYALTQIKLRGRDKALTLLRWFALANNILQAHRLAKPA